MSRNFSFYPADSEGSKNVRLFSSSGFLDDKKRLKRAFNPFDASRAEVKRWKSCPVAQLYFQVSEAGIVAFWLEVFGDVVQVLAETGVESGTAEKGPISSRDRLPENR